MVVDGGLVSGSPRVCRLSKQSAAVSRSRSCWNLASSFSGWWRTLGTHTYGQTDAWLKRGSFNDWLKTKQVVYLNLDHCEGDWSRIWALHGLFHHTLKQKNICNYASFCEPFTREMDWASKDDPRGLHCRLDVLRIDWSISIFNELMRDDDLKLDSRCLRSNKSKVGLVILDRWWPLYFPVIKLQWRSVKPRRWSNVWRGACESARCAAGLCQASGKKDADMSISSSLMTSVWRVSWSNCIPTGMANSGDASGLWCLSKRQTIMAECC